MPMIKIPHFVEKMGHRILSFILNVDDDVALEVINGMYDLDANRFKVLNEFIQICHESRKQAIAQRYHEDVLMFDRLSKIFQKNRHIFNVWHEKLGGKQVNVGSVDPMVASASRMALEVYPLLLIKRSTHRAFASIVITLHPLIDQLKERQILLDGIMADPSLVKLFTHVGKNERDTHSQYMTSTGHQGELKLAEVPHTLIANAFGLMKIRGDISRKALLDSVTEMVEMLRNIGEGKQIEVLAFVGFHNVGLDDFSEMDIESGKIRAYNNEILSLIPNQAEPLKQGKEQKILGLIFEYKYPYKVILGEQQDRNGSLLEFEKARKKLEVAQENLSLTLALAINRTKPIGIHQAWWLVFNPLGTGIVIWWKHNAGSPMPPYFLKSNEIEAITRWSKLIKEIDDAKIRLAIRRILSSMNERMNPIDGFIDAIIAWENLFGGKTEISYRISISFAKLLKESPEERKELQREIANFYSKRSKILHGSKENDADNPVKNRNKCLKIALDAIKKLYEEHPNLLNDDASERSKKLALL